MSKKKVFGEEGDLFVVNNYEDNYAGIITLAQATAQSDNSVYAQLGIDLGTRRVARLARRMGIRTPISTNRAMTLGGLEQGRDPARDGLRVLDSGQPRHAHVRHARRLRARACRPRAGRAPARR